MSSYLNFYKKNGYLVKENLINQKLINQINKVVNEVVYKEKRKRKKNDEMELNPMTTIILFIIQKHPKIRKFCD